MTIDNVDLEYTLDAVPPVDQRDARIADLERELANLRVAALLDAATIIGLTQELGETNLAWAAQWGETERIRAFFKGANAAKRTARQSRARLVCLVRALNTMLLFWEWHGTKGGQK